MIPMSVAATNLYLWVQDTYTNKLVQENLAKVRTRWRIQGEDASQTLWRKVDGVELA